MHLPANGCSFSVCQDVCDVILVSADAGMTHRKKVSMFIPQSVSHASRGCRDTFIGSLLPWESFSAAVAMATHCVDDGPEVFFHLTVEVDAELLSSMLGDGGK